MRPLDSGLKQFLTDLVIEQNAPTGWRPSDEVRDAMIEEIEGALIDSDALEPILDYLKTIPNKALDWEESIFEKDEDLMIAIDGGLGALYEQSPELFFGSVVDPFALLELRDNIYEVLTPYWWEKIRLSGSREPRTADEIWDSTMEEAGLGQGLALTTFDLGDGPRRWVVTAENDRVTRIAPEGAPTPTVTVEFSLAPQANVWTLEVDLLDPPPSTESRRSGRLIAADGEELGRVEDEANALAFTIAHPNVLKGAELACEDRRNGGEHFQFRIPVDVP
jgi:hypothetical protein